MQIRKRDGTVSTVRGDYILADGETLLVPASFVDARRGMIHDGLGGPVGQRPGFLINDDDERAAQATRDAYATYDAEIGNRWQSQRWQSQPSKPARSEPQRFGTGDAAVADAYAQYDRDLAARWQRR